MSSERLMKNKTYFKEGKWSIVSHQNTWDTWSMSKFSAIRHKCKRYWRSHITQPINIWKVDVPICSTCHEQVPEGVMGLWTLHNWDAMQAAKSSKERWTSRPGQVWEYYPGAGNGRSG